MRRLLVSLLAMAALLAGLDRGLGVALARLYRDSASVEDGDFLRRAWEARPAIVACGSSRAMHHYVADTLGARLGTTAWNLGRDGAAGALYEYGASGVVLRHWRPALWIMDVDTTLTRGHERLDRLACFLPHADTEPAAREVALRRSPHERIRMLSQVYRYNSLVLSLLAPRLGKHVEPRRGYLPLAGRWTPDPDAAPAALPWRDAPRDSLAIRTLRATIDALHAHGVRVIAVRGPRVLDSPEVARGEVMELSELRAALGPLGVDVIDFSARAIPALRERRLYRDGLHLNDDGALVFTRALADTLRARRLVP